MKKIMTIIVPAYNMEQLLQKNLSSLVVSPNLRQYLEVLVINDGSTDKTTKIAHIFEEQYPEIFKVIDKKNGNYGSCINVGLSQASGHFVKIVDADDYVDTYEFEKLLTELIDSEENNEQLDLVFTNYKTVNTNGEVLRSFSTNIPENKILEICKNTDKQYFNRIQHHAITYRTSLLRNMDYFQTERCPYTDQEWIMIPLLFVSRIKYFRFDLYRYLIGREGQSMDKKIIAKSAVAHAKVGIEIVNKYENYKNKASLINCDIVECLIVDYFQYFYKMFMLTNTSSEAIAEIEKTDKALKNINANIYNALNKATYGKKKNYRFIYEWRMNKHNLRLFILRMINIIIK